MGRRGMAAALAGRGAKAGCGSGKRLATPPLIATLRPSKPKKMLRSEYMDPKIKKKKMVRVTKAANRKILIVRNAG